MNDQELDALVAAVGTPRRSEVEPLPLGGSAIELRELIMTTTDSETTSEKEAATDNETTAEIVGGRRVLEHRPSTRRSASERRTHRRRRFAIVAGAAAAATAVAVGLVTMTPTGNDSAQNTPNSAYADELVAVAEGAPRLLITADGWSITRADEFGAEYGELEFTDGNQIVGLFWRPVDLHQSYLDDRAAGQDALGDITVAGHDGKLFHYPSDSSDPDRFTALWIDADHSVELDGSQASEADFRALAATLQAVAVETWLDAMPESVISPTDRTAAIADMLAGIPVPPGFDQSVLASFGVSDRYQLGAQVTGAVACGWLDLWVAAEAAGDQAAMTQAAEAMASARSWPILLEMDAEGYYPEVLWQYADALATGGITVLGKDIRAGVEGLSCPA